MHHSKVCFKCHQEKPITDFYKHPMMGDGHLNKCKECTRADVRSNYRDKIDYYKAYDQRRAMRDDRVAARASYQKTPAGKEAVARARRKTTKRYPRAKWATSAVSHALRDKKLIRPLVCEVCKEEKRLHAHHDDYAKPLDVRWLCTTCHRDWHRHHTPRNRGYEELP